MFGVKVDTVIKGGMVVGAKMGDPNGSIAYPQPIMFRPMFGYHGKSIQKCSFNFVSQASLDNGKVEGLGLGKKSLPVTNCRNVFKKDMVHNHATPNIEVNPETYEVRANGELLTCEPLSEIPMAQRYFLF
jgi:urease subunit alpha